MMKARLSEYVLANVASMSVTARRGMPVLLLYSSIGVAEAEKSDECKSYLVLPTAPDKDTAERARDVLHDRGWSDFDPPEGLAISSISLAPPANSSAPTSKEANQARIVESANATDPSRSPEGKAPKETAPVADHEDNVLEHFEGFVDYIEDGTAYVTLKSREHGDELSGEYSAALLSEKGIKEQHRFNCKTVRVGDATRVEIEAVPKVAVTEEQIREIDEELNRMLPDDDDVDY